jgi:hypothetical protein
MVIHEIRRIMRIQLAILILCIALLFVILPVQAAGSPPVDATPIPASQSTGPITGFPWALILVFIVAGLIMNYLKKDNPNKITSTTCLPLIDEKKMEAEKRKIAEEEASQNKS